MGGYATTEHLAHYLADAPPENAHALLARAARVVDRLARLIRYDVDEHGDATDPTVRAALRDACCAQVQAWLDTGQADPRDGAGHALAREGLGSIAFGALNLSTGAAGSFARTPGASADWGSPAAETLEVLAAAGLWPPRVTVR